MMGPCISKQARESQTSLDAAVARSETQLSGIRAENVALGAQNASLREAEAEAIRNLATKSDLVRGIKTELRVLHEQCAEATRIASSEKRAAASTSESQERQVAALRTELEALQRAFDDLEDASGSRHASHLARANDVRAMNVQVATLSETLMRERELHATTVAVLQRKLDVFFTPPRARTAQQNALLVLAGGDAGTVPAGCVLLCFSLSRPRLLYLSLTHTHSLSRCSNVYRYVKKDELMQVVRRVHQEEVDKHAAQTLLLEREIATLRVSLSAAHALATPAEVRRLRAVDGAPLSQTMRSGVAFDISPGTSSGAGTAVTPPTSLGEEASELGRRVHVNRHGSISVSRDGMATTPVPTLARRTEAQLPREQ